MKTIYILPDKTCSLSAPQPPVDGYAHLKIGGVYHNFNCSANVHENETLSVFGNCSGLATIIELNTTTEAYDGQGNVDYEGQFQIHMINGLGTTSNQEAMFAYMTFSKPITTDMISTEVT